MGRADYCRSYSQQRALRVLHVYAKPRTVLCMRPLCRFRVACCASVQELLTQLADTKALKEVAALQHFFELLNTDMSRAFYGFKVRRMHAPRCCPLAHHRTHDARAGGQVGVAASCADGLARGCCAVRHCTCQP